MWLDYTVQSGPSTCTPRQSHLSLMGRNTSTILSRSNWHVRTPLRPEEKYLKDIKVVERCPCYCGGLRMSKKYHIISYII
jgi:hypothetical protein